MGEQSAASDLSSFERLIRVETKLDGLIDTVSRGNTEIVKDIVDTKLELRSSLDATKLELKSSLEDHEKRIRYLEKFIWIALGISTAVSVGAQYAIRLWS